MRAKNIIQKNMFAIGTDKGGKVRSIGRVDTFDEVRESVERNAAAKLATEVRLMNFSQLDRVVYKIMEG
jgi:hypothetical protein